MLKSQHSIPCNNCYIRQSQRYLINPLSRKSIGAYAERVVEFYLKSKGHTILARNLRLKTGEIDILSSLGGVLFVVEVKSSLVFISKGATGTENPAAFASKHDFLPEGNLSRTKITKLKRLRSELLMRQSIENTQVYICGFTVDLYYSKNQSRFISIKVRSFPDLC